MTRLLRPDTSPNHGSQGGSMTAKISGLMTLNNDSSTEDCFYSTGEPPVYYTLHIRSVDELRTYGALAEEGGYDQFTLDMIKATEIVKAAPTPTPEVAKAAPTFAVPTPTARLVRTTPTQRWISTPTPAPKTCFTEQATLRGPEGALYFEWVPKARLCDSHEPTGSVKRQPVPEEVRELFRQERLPTIGSDN